MRSIQPVVLLLRACLQVLGVLRAVGVLGYNRPELSKKVLNFLVSLLVPGAADMATATSVLTARSVLPPTRYVACLPAGACCAVCCAGCAEPHAYLLRVDAMA
jgi:hypothetical protein